MRYVIPGSSAFADKRIAVLGLGVSGKACVTALTSVTQAVVSVWDAKETAINPYLDDVRVDLAISAAKPEILMQMLLDWQPDIVIIAPGFPQMGYEWTVLREAGVPVWSEIELAWHLRAADEQNTVAPWLCVTGTNGKTTTVSILAKILAAAGCGTVATGNIGKPLITEVIRTDENAPQAFAIELSSFQLAATYSMAPTAAVCLNIDDDHLEWHGNRAEYWAAKAKIYEHVQTACLYPVGDREVQRMVDEADVQEGARAIGLNIGTPSVGEFGLVEDIIVDRAFHKNRFSAAQEVFTVADIAHLAPRESSLPLHLLKDAIAAAALARAVGVAPQFIRSALRDFTSGKHRIEFVGSYAGMNWIDDSKATNAHAAKSSILAQEKTIQFGLSAGLRKGQDLKSLPRQSKTESIMPLLLGPTKRHGLMLLNKARFAIV
ncbi:UDP-N-acetylmuramoyl-L-alanine--D-glutamate ligase [Arcanobacterium hippocoleae]